MYSFLNHIVIWRCWSLSFLTQMQFLLMHNSFSLCYWCCTCNRFFWQLNAGWNQQLCRGWGIGVDILAEEILSMSQCFVLCLVKWRQKLPTTLMLMWENDILWMKIIYHWCHADVAPNYSAHHRRRWLLNVFKPDNYLMSIFLEFCCC